MMPTKPGEATPMKEMPRYKCHKEVWALKIRTVGHLTEPDGKPNGKAILGIADEGFADVRVDAEFMRKHGATPGGYYVVYEDGYKSFSPADVFEKGYTLIGK